MTTGVPTGGTTGVPTGEAAGKPPGAVTIVVVDTGAAPPAVDKTLGSTALTLPIPVSSIFNVSALEATILPVVSKVPTVAVPEPSALIPMPVLGNKVEMSSCPMFAPEGVAAALPIVIPVVGFPCASIPLVTTGTPRLMVCSGKLIASKSPAGNVLPTE